MEKMHWHTSVENVLIYGISAIIVINLVRLASAQLLNNEQTAGAGRALGALV